MPGHTTIRACVIAFPLMDLVDFASPIETLSHARSDDGTRHFQVTVAGTNPELETSSGVVVKSHIDVDTAARTIDEYDVLIVPGGSLKVVEDLLKPGEAIVSLIKRFSTLESETDNETSRVLMSICSGAFFLSYAGVLGTRDSTTHWSILHQLREMGQPHGAPSVSRRRFVDGGLLGNGPRVITSGGITSGFDASLYLIEKMVNRDCANKAAETLDYQWRRSEGSFPVGES